MGVPLSEVGYIAAMSRREDHEVHKDMWWHWTKKKVLTNFVILWPAVCPVDSNFSTDCPENIVCDKICLFEICGFDGIGNEHSRLRCVTSCGPVEIYHLFCSNRLRPYSGTGSSSQNIVLLFARYLLSRFFKYKIMCHVNERKRVL